MNCSTTSVVNLPLNKETARELLRTSNAEILFTKKDGTKRLMKCTLREGESTRQEEKTERTVKTNDSILSVWDLEASAWRTINLDTVESVSVY